MACVSRSIYIRFQPNLTANWISLKMIKLVCDSSSNNSSCGLVVCLLFIKYKYFSSFEAGNCVSNSRFRWMKWIHIRFSSTKVKGEPITPYMTWIIMSLYGVIGYHVTLWEGHMIANHPIYGGDWLSCDPLRGSHASQSPHIRKHLWQLWFICHKFIHTI